MLGPDAAPGFALAETREAGSVVLHVRGDLDIAAVGTLGERLTELRRERVPTRLDLADVPFMDSSGMACVVQAVAEARAEDWDLQVGRDLSDQVQRLIELVQGQALFWPSATA